MDKIELDNLFKIYKPIQDDWKLFWIVSKVERTGATLGFCEHILSKSKGTICPILIGIDIGTFVKVELE